MEFSPQGVSGSCCHTERRAGNRDPEADGKACSLVGKESPVQDGVWSSQGVGTCLSILSGPGQIMLST